MTASIKITKQSAVAKMNNFDKMPVDVRQILNDWDGITAFNALRGIGYTMREAERFIGGAQNRFGGGIRL